MATISGEQIERAGAPLYLMWQWRPGLSLAEEIGFAAARLLEKEGITANVCLLRPDHFTKVRDMIAPDLPEGAPFVLDGVTVRPRAGVQRGTMWVGREAGA
jgi:hypothetical protein